MTTLMRILSVALLTGIAIGCWSVIGAEEREERVALVIGNGDYRNVENLPTPKNDAEAIGEALDRLDFDVDVKTDLDQRGMQEALRAFGLKAQSADVAMVFFSGHGIQAERENYLVPTDAELRRDRDLIYEALPLRAVLSEVAQARHLGLVILDACRDNPLADRLRASLGPIRSRIVRQGLARLENLPPGTMIAFAAGFDQVAVDGEGDHSPYTSALLSHIEQPGVELDLMFQKVRDTVLADTAAQQEPLVVKALGIEPRYLVIPNERPQLPQIAALEVLDNAVATTLKIPRATDPDAGDELNGRVTSLPRSGQITVGSRTLAVGDVLSIDELTTAAFTPAEGEIGNVGTFRFLIEDGRGGTVAGQVPINVEHANRPPKVVAERQFEPPSALPLGIERPEDPEGDPFDIVVTEVPKGSAIKTGNEVVQIGDELTPDALSKLMIHPGPDGAKGAFRFRATDSRGASASSTTHFNLAAVGSQLVIARATEAGTAEAGPTAGLPPTKPTAVPAEESEPSEDQPTEAELRLWQSIENRRDPSAFEEYLRQFPDGVFVTSAQQRLDALRPEPVPAEVEQFVALEAAMAVAVLDEQRVALRNSNVRAGPSVDHEIAGSITAGTSVHVTGRVEDVNWLRITKPEGGDAYIWAPLLAAPRSTFRDCPDCPRMVVIPKGDFKIGSRVTEAGRSDDEGPEREVRIPKPYAMGRYEVTRGEYAAFIQATGYEPGGTCTIWEGNEWRADASKGWRDTGFDQTDDHPVVCVRWADAQAYVDWLSQHTGQSYRLPSEAEWEYAARAGSETARPWGDRSDTACEHANTYDEVGRESINFDWQHHKCRDDHVFTAPVGSFRANALGLYDMLGNAWEWTADCWHDSYDSLPTDGAVRGEGNCNRRLLRGGAWANHPAWVRSAKRYSATPELSIVGVGIRVVREIPDLQRIRTLPDLRSTTAALPPSAQTNEAETTGGTPVGFAPDCAVCPDLVQIPAGRFVMGSKDGDASERPAHQVTIERAFALGQYEVTVAQWQACVEAGTCAPLPDAAELADNTPVRNVSWNEAQGYASWLSELTGQRYRLPSEAEWEYAARGGTSTRFWWADEIGEGNANCADCGGEWDKTAPAAVGAHRANGFGLHDMNGGAMEWVADCWSRNYQGAPENGLVVTEGNCLQRVLRGGSWRNDHTYVTSTSRLSYDVDVRYYTHGFRVARDLN